jgi:nucleoside-triphosphatase THEP1
MKIIEMKAFEKRRYKTLPFRGCWADSFGEPEENAHWMIYGESGHGKTEFCCQLAAYLGEMRKVLYVSAEQGDSASLRLAFERNKLLSNKRIKLVVNATFDEVKELLDGKNTADVVIFDSIDYMDLTVRNQKLLSQAFKRKMFIFISWAKGKSPITADARKILFRVDIKVRVKDFVAFAASRFGGIQPYIISPERAKAHHPFLNH